MWFFQRAESTFIFYLITTFLYGISAEGDDTCRQAVFQRVSEGAPLAGNVSNHYVESLSECGLQCFQKGKACALFSHLPEKNNVDVNCKLSYDQAKDGREETIDYTDDVWTTYEIKDIVSIYIKELCLTKSLCQNGGQCISNACETKGYSCKCTKKYYGKHCEKENNDYDLSLLSNQPVKSYVQINAIEKDLNQLTISVWFKMSIGLNDYHLVSYAANGSTGFIDLSFHAANGKAGLVSSFLGGVALQNEYTWMTPVNDNFWHHLGFTWNNAAGDWNVFIDGTQRGQKDGIKIGVIIPGGGTLVIGQKQTLSGFQKDTEFFGEISRFNLWDTYLSGYEIEAMAEVPGNERGNVIMWFNILDYLVGNIGVITPSNAHNTDQKLDFELSFKSPPTGKNYVQSPAAKFPFDLLSVCLWIKIPSKSVFILYDATHGFTIVLLPSVLIQLI